MMSFWQTSHGCPAEGLVRVGLKHTRLASRLPCLCRATEWEDDGFMWRQSSTGEARARKWRILDLVAVVVEGERQHDGTRLWFAYHEVQSILSEFCDSDSSLNTIYFFETDPYGEGRHSKCSKEMQIPALKKNFCIIYPLYKPMAPLGLRFPPQMMIQCHIHSEFAFLLNKKANGLKPTATTHVGSLQFWVDCNSPLSRHPRWYASSFRLNRKDVVFQQ